MQSAPAWRRVYITTGRARLATGVASEAVHDQAEQYRRRLDTVGDGWRGTYECDLPGMRDKEPDRPIVFKVTDDDGYEIGHYGHEGFVPTRLFTDFEDGVAQFGSMVMYYATDEHAELSPTEVAAAVHPEDEGAWWNVLDAYREATDDG